MIFVKCNRLLSRTELNWIKTGKLGQRGKIKISLHSISWRCFWLAMATLELNQLTIGLLTSCEGKRKKLRGNYTEETTKRIKWKNYQFSELCGKTLITSIFRIFLESKSTTFCTNPNCFVSEQAVVCFLTKSGWFRQLKNQYLNIFFRAIIK